MNGQRQPQSKAAKTRAGLHRDIEAGRFDDCVVIPTQTLVEWLLDVEARKRTPEQVAAEFAKKEQVYDMRRTQPTKGGEGQ